MRPLSLSVITFIAACLLPGCDRADPDRATPAVASDVPAPADAAPVPSDTDTSAVTMRYSCGDHQVDVMGNDHARVTMPDGRLLQLGYVADSSPPLFAGEALEFSIDGSGAQLAQDEGASWPCSAE
jgi:membrane-bound inhibitor of C-type lysozyme